MLKTEAIKILGGTPSSAAREIGITPQAVSLWPDVLSDATRDRVQAALWRRRRKSSDATNMIQNQSNGNNVT